MTVLPDCPIPCIGGYLSDRARFADRMEPGQAKIRRYALKGQRNVETPVQPGDDCVRHSSPRHYGCFDQIRQGELSLFSLPVRDVGSRVEECAHLWGDQGVRIYPAKIGGMP